MGRGVLRVVACSAAAGGLGIAVGMPVAEATALGDVRLEPYDPVADRRALEELADACDPFSPIVGLEDAEHPECLFLDLTGLAPLFGDEETIVELVARMLDERGLDARLAVADTPAAAWAAAHYADQAAFTPGIIIPCGSSREALTPLPIAALRLPDETITVLAALGIRRIEQLWALPRESLASRFGSGLIRRIDQALGIVAETIVSHRPPPAVVVERRLEYPLHRRELIERVIEQLIAEAAAVLAQRQQGVVRLECQLHGESDWGLAAVSQPAPIGGCSTGGESPGIAREVSRSGHYERFVVGLYRPSAAARHLFELVKLRLERVQLPGPIVAIRLAVLVAARLESRQQELFADPRDDPRRLALLVDRLSGRLDRQAVLKARLVPDAQPEFACRLEPLAGNVWGTARGEKNRRRGPKTRHEENNQQPPAAACRPVWLEPHPVAVEVLSVVPEGPPRRFTVWGQQYTIRGSWGPERIQTGWWRGAYICRDYYRVEVTGGRRFWLFRTRSGRWFLHGVFD